MSGLNKVKDVWLLSNIFIRGDYNHEQNNEKFKKEFLAVFFKYILLVLKENRRDNELLLLHEKIEKPIDKPIEKKSLVSLFSSFSEGESD